MKLRSSAVVALAAVCVSAPARAEDAAPPTVLTTPVLTVYGRVERPLVQIVLPRRVAAADAALAHRSLIAARLDQGEPATLHTLR